MLGEQAWQLHFKKKPKFECQNITNMKSKTKEYTNGEITVVWKPGICIHSALCANGLPGVFDPQARPWIKVEGDTTEAIAKQIDKCPSGALSYYYNESKKGEVVVENETIVEVNPNGPLMVYGNLLIKDSEGNETKKHKVTAFCRCGASSNKPFCDGTHKKIGFEG